MADCTSPTLSVPDLTCTSDLPTWATAFVAAAQAAVDHVVGCIQDFEYPTCDICVLKDDLVNCPLDVDTMDFTDIAWADEGGIGVMPYPPSIAGLAFRYGVGTIDRDAFHDAWRSVAITFDTPFATECVHVSVTCVSSTRCQGVPFPGPSCSSGVDIVGAGYGIMVQASTISTTGCTVWIYRDDFDCECDVNFTYLAAGH